MTIPSHPLPIPSLKLWILPTSQRLMPASLKRWCKAFVQNLGLGRVTSRHGHGPAVVLQHRAKHPNPPPVFFFFGGGGGRFLESVFVFNVEWRDDSAVEKNYSIMVLGILWLKKTMESDEWIEFLQKKSLQLWLWKRKNLTTHQLFVHQFYRVNPTNSSTWKWQLWISIVWFFWHAPKKIHLKWPGPHIFTETLAGRGEILCNSRRPPWTTL